MKHSSLALLLATSLSASTSPATAFVLSKPASNSRSLVARSLFNMKKEFAAPCVMGDEEIMSKKAHGTSDVPVQKNLRWNCDYDTAEHYAEYAGYWTSTSFVEEARKEYAEKGEITFYDSNTGKPLFVAPKGRDLESFLKESASHGWPSFRDEEVIWDNVRCLPDGESVSLAGTHLGHNLPDRAGNRYCINLVSVAGRPAEESKE